jgi:hypothetical protein
MTKPPERRSASMMTSSEIRAATKPHVQASPLPNPFDEAVDKGATITGNLSTAHHDPKHIPVLMSPDNPNGWKLEDLLLQLTVEITGKNLKIENDHRSEAIVVHNNNNRIIEMLRDCYRLQTNSMETLAKIGPNQGPLGKPRIGEGSE